MSASQAAVRPGPDIFLSYRRSDRELAGELVSVLERRGPSVWWDADIAGGEDWRDTIVEQLSAARCLVIVFSEACNTSKQLKKELAVADHLDKEVIPVLIEPTEPRGFFLYELASRQWISIHPSPREKLDLAAQLLVERLGAMGWSALPEASGRPLPPPLPAAAAPAPAGPPGRRDRARGHGPLGDLFPFRWVDLVLPTIVAAIALVSGNGGAVGERVATAVFLFVAILASTALIAFPIRYYRRRVNPRRVAGALVIVNAAFALLATAAGLSLGRTDADAGLAPADSGDDVWLGLVFVAVLVALTSFVIFFVLSKARARRAYRAGIVRV